MTRLEKSRRSGRAAGTLLAGMLAASVALAGPAGAGGDDFDTAPGDDAIAVGEGVGVDGFQIFFLEVEVAEDDDRVFPDQVEITSAFEAPVGTVITLAWHDGAVATCTVTTSGGACAGAGGVVLDVFEVDDGVVRGEVDNDFYPRCPSLQPVTMTLGPLATSAHLAAC